MPLSRKINLDAGNGQTFNEPWERIAGDYTAQVGDRLLLDARTGDVTLTLPSQGLTDGEQISLIVVIEGGKVLVNSAANIESLKVIQINQTDLACSCVYSETDLSWLMAGADNNYSLGYPATYSQSSNLWGLVGNSSNLRDRSVNNGVVTDSVPNPSWIQADLGISRALNSVTVSGGNCGSQFNQSNNLNGASLQTSTDGSNWVTRATVSGVQDTGADLFKRFSVTGVNARFVRLSKASFLATSNFWID